VVARDSARPGTPRRRGRLVALGAVAVAAVVSLTGCSANNLTFGWPRLGVSEQAHSMYYLWVGACIAAMIVGILVWGLIFWCVIRYRKRPGDTELPLQTRYNLPIELVYSVVPFLIVSVLFFYTAVAQTKVDKISAHPDVTVDVTAFKWNWQFTYENDNDKSGQPITTIGDSDYVPMLVVPTHKTILFVENSRDVIHSFWVPELLFKRDVFPGNVKNKFQVTIDTEGEYIGRCAELCGEYHSQMNFELLAVPFDDYQKFVAAKQSGLSTPQALASLGDPGRFPPYATKTQPFDTTRGQTVPTNS
jgi:cytochrome c oxidase subunit 2